MTKQQYEKITLLLFYYTKVNFLRSISGNSYLFFSSIVEGTVAHISCTRQYNIIKMVSAEYRAQARPFSNYCNLTKCHKDVLSVTRNLCDGKQSCAIKVSNDFFFWISMQQFVSVQSGGDVFMW